MGAGLSSSSQMDGSALTLEVQFACPIRVEEVIKISEDAGKAILDIYNADESKWEVNIKSDDSPLTKADLTANAVIVNALKKISPHIPIITEEEAAVPYAIRKKYQYFWLVDPLDGTKEFLKRNGQFTVNIALMADDSPVMGVVHVPVLDKTYWAVKGKGSWLRDGSAPHRQIQVAEFALDDEGLTLVGSASHLSAETQEFVGLFKNPKFAQLGSSLKLLQVAEGTAHIYPRLAPTMEWDTAAADIVVREAGGAVIQAGLCDNQGKALEDWKEVLQQEKVVVYNKENMLNPYFVVFGKRRSDAPSGAFTFPQFKPW